MENFSTLIENSKRAVRYWWLLLIIGIALFVVGILVFVYPTQSYLGMSLLFGWRPAGPGPRSCLPLQAARWWRWQTAPPGRMRCWEI